MQGQQNKQKNKFHSDAQNHKHQSNQQKESKNSSHGNRNDQKKYRDYKEMIDSNDIQENQNNKHYNQINKKRTQKERDQDELKTIENMKNSLNEYFYYDQEKQKYFRKRDEHKNNIIEGKEVGMIETIEEVAVDNDENPYKIYDMNQIEQSTLKIDPRQLKQQFKKQNRLLHDEFISFYEQKDIIDYLKQQYKNQYIQNQTKIDNPSYINELSKFILINNYKTKIISYDFSHHDNYNLIIFATKSESQNTVQFIVICLNKYNQVQIIKLVPNILQTQFIKLIVLPVSTQKIQNTQELSQRQQTSQQQRSQIQMNQSQQRQQQQQQLQGVQNDQDSEIDYGIYITKQKITIFKYELVNIQNIQQTFLEEIISPFEILDVEKYLPDQILVQTLKELKCYDIKQKKYVFKIHLQNYNAKSMRFCKQNMIAVIYTESQKLLVVCLTQKKCLFSTIMTNLTDFQIIQESKDKIQFIYQRLNQNLLFLNLTKQGKRWNWTKVQQDQQLMQSHSSQKPLRLEKIGQGSKQIMILENNIYLKDKVIGLFNENKIQKQDNRNRIEEEKEEQISIQIETIFQINQIIFIVYYNDYNLNIQYFKTI